MRLFTILLVFLPCIGFAQIAHELKVDGHAWRHIGGVDLYYESIVPVGTKGIGLELSYSFLPDFNSSGGIYLDKSFSFKYVSIYNQIGVSPRYYFRYHPKLAWYIGLNYQYLWFKRNKIKELNVDLNYFPNVFKYDLLYSHHYGFSIGAQLIAWKHFVWEPYFALYLNIDNPASGYRLMTAVFDVVKFGYKF